MKKVIFIFIAVHLLFSCERNDLYDFANSVNTKLQIILGSGTLTMNWDVVNGAVSYQIWYNTMNDPVTATPSIGGDIITNSETITGLTNGTLYYVWLKVKYEAGGTAKIITSGTGKPVAAPVVSIIPASTTLSLNWPPVTGADSYEVWYGLTNVQENAVQVGGVITGSGYSITGLTSSTTYYIWMRSKNSTGTSSFSSMQTGLTNP
jgi:hypothetical protein